MGTTLPPDPSAAMLNLSALAQLLGVSIITWCITRVTEKYSLLARKTWTTIPWARICLLLVLVVAWLYLIMTGVLLHGAPRQHESHRCSIGIIMCLICYCANKGLVYLCLIERARAVWSTSQQRWRSPIYLFCLSLLLPLVGTLAGLLLPQAIHYVYSGYCVIGTNQPSSIFLLAYDMCINLLLTGMFVVPLIRAKIRSVWLRTVAMRSTVATVIALLTTSVNFVVLYILDGSEAIWICFGGCTVDIVIGSVVLYWALQGPEETSGSGAQTIYLSPIGDIPTFQPGAFESIARSQDCLAVSYNLSRPDNRSETTLAVSDVCIPSLEKPQPAIQMTALSVFREGSAAKETGTSLTRGII
ncbi:transmembrane protein, putative [Rhizoctonia solani AG-3 Rhs1AP]|uniref:Transmembrane protein, putative n=1 Tax=Rhizoctonia solani AG-3 Rhs1AP TaxID=1086054 RepID=X8J5N6_9AGAM|nr:transmembrane protein, putative [Rhizoctonia solani AG-3 Rhs1AP]